MKLVMLVRSWQAAQRGDPSIQPLVESFQDSIHRDAMWDTNPVDQHILERHKS